MHDEEADLGHGTGTGSRVLQLRHSPAEGVIIFRRKEDFIYVKG